MSNSRVITLEMLQNDNDFIGILRFPPQRLPHVFEGRGFLLGVDSIIPTRNENLTISRAHSGEASTSTSEVRTSEIVTSSYENADGVPLPDIETTSNNIISENMESVTQLDISSLSINNTDLMNVSFTDLYRSNIPGVYVYEGVDDITWQNIISHLPPESIIDDRVIEYYLSWDILLLPFDLMTLPSFWVGTVSIGLALYLNLTEQIIYDSQLIMDLTQIAWEGGGIITFGHSGHFPLSALTPINFIWNRATRRYGSEYVLGMYTPLSILTSIPVNQRTTRNLIRHVLRNYNTRIGGHFIRLWQRNLYYITLPEYIPGRNYIRSIINAITLIFPSSRS